MRKAFRFFFALKKDGALAQNTPCSSKKYSNKGKNFPKYSFAIQRRNPFILKVFKQKKDCFLCKELNNNFVKIYSKVVNIFIDR